MKKNSTPLRHLACLLAVCAITACSKSDDAPPSDPDPGGMQNPGNPDNTNPDPPQQQGLIPCENGLAGPYPCSGYDLVGHLSLSEMGAAAGNDIWGWTDPQDGTEYALVGLDNGTAFISLADPENPLYLGKLGTQTANSTWRDIKVLGNYAYIVSEASGHGMQVFDLTSLRGVVPPRTFSSATVYSEFGNAHNIVINEASGFAYAVGTGSELPYGGGPHFIDINTPESPVNAGGYSGAGYTHDAQVVTYNGPDADYAGREILIGANENRVLVLDVTDKAQPQMISDFGYANLAYTHQGWFTEDHRYFLLGDEVDELSFGLNSRTLVFDMTDLDAPVLHHTYSGPTTAIDHNGYVDGDLFYLANYTAGVRVIDLSQLDSKGMSEIGFFDTYPAANQAAFNGVWSVYPYLDSGNILVNDIDNGFFVIRPSDTTP